MQRKIRKVLTILAGLFSFTLFLYGAAAVIGMDLRQNTMLSVVYCALPLLSFPLFLISISVRGLLPLQAVLAVVYIAVYSALNWRTCAELGYCVSIASVVLLTITTWKALLFCAAGLCSLAAFVMERRGQLEAKRT